MAEETIQRGMRLSDRLNILLAAMLLGVFAILFVILYAIQSASDNFNKTEKEHYNQYRIERDADFKKFTKESIELLADGLKTIREDDDTILTTLKEKISSETAKVNQSANTITEAVKEAESKPSKVVHTIEHRTEVISDSELKRRQKAAEAMAKYKADLAAWKAKYGKKKH